MANTKWILDPTHSELSFKIRHLMIGNVSGKFKNFSAEVSMESEDFSTATVRLTAEMASIDTSNEQRDAHLRNSDFFEVDKYPELTFQSTRVVKIDNDTYTLHGNLTMKGVSRPVELKVEQNGVTKDPWGGERAGFLVTGKIRRADWGVTFNSVMETGGVALGEEVKISSEIQVVKQAVEIAA